MTAGPRLRLGISTCLTGERTRYDAGHKYDPCLLEILGPYAEWVPVCPEVEVGLPVSREPMRLEGPPDSPRLMTHHTRQDLTERMGTWAKRRVGELGALGLDGFILKSRSPSCGLFAVPVYDDQGCQTGEGRGLFAAELVRQLPLLPVEEEGRLYAPDRRDNFIERAFAWRRLRGLLQEGPTPGALVAFHTAHKMVLLAHSPEAYHRLGRLVAGAGTADPQALAAGYAGLFMQALQVPATVGRHVNVLQHLLGFLGGDLTPGDKAELLEAIEDYRQGRLPLLVPTTLLKYHLGRAAVSDWVGQQVYLNPDPAELMLRYHA